MSGKIKLKRLPRTTIKEVVTSVSGVPTWTLVLFKRILEITGKQSISEVWPALELYMHGGVSFTPYKEQFEKLIGKTLTTSRCTMQAKVSAAGTTR